MSRTEHVADPFDPFGQFQTMRDQTMDLWSKSMMDFVNSEAYSSASAKWLDSYLSLSEPFRRAMDQAMSQALSACKMPSTDDVTRLAERLTNIEFRLDDLDKRLDKFDNRIDKLDNRNEKLDDRLDRVDDSLREISKLLKDLSATLAPRPPVTARAHEPETHREKQGAAHAAKASPHTGAPAKETVKEPAAAAKGANGVGPKHEEKKPTEKRPASPPRAADAKPATAEPKKTEKE